MAIGGQVPHFAVRFRWHALGVVNKSQGGSRSDSNTIRLAGVELLPDEFRKTLD